ncbi:twin-arginine translocation signal domain-containing protein [Spirosoma utsteinense]|uniref:Twin-arginine translocation signal domain-containing protein n=1 Tax=Spirosoma utsteinense TaxID=2585773 RepID=A0ABR6WGP8_9BACT|nr:twin-arginine translocation signal domain-containing protein [Spirosoma utsteinense]MBC3789292.1 hypothetical protein [Spirosoma utsteinense]MBC3795222.1 hypothetical protein [Spirosoma utsteinense]
MTSSRRTFLKLSTLSVAATSVAATAFPIPAVSASGPAGIPTAAKPVILLRSSWNDANIGDQGHTPGTLRLLEQYVPEAEIILWHQSPRPETESVIVKRFPAVTIVRGDFYEGDKPFEGELKRSFRPDYALHRQFGYGV